MLRKTDKYLKRFAYKWQRGKVDRELTSETVRRETWWLLWFIPLYSRDTIWSKPY